VRRTRLMARTCDRKRLVKASVYALDLSARDTLRAQAVALDVTSVDGGDGLIDRARRGMLGLPLVRRES
jgi:hypothetical protein